MWASSSFALLISSGTTISTYRKKKKKKKKKWPNYKCHQLLSKGYLLPSENIKHLYCLPYVHVYTQHCKKIPSHLWHYVIDDQSCKYWIWFSRIEYTNSQTHSMFKSCKSSSWLEREHIQSPWIASLVGSLHCCTTKVWK